MRYSILSPSPTHITQKSLQIRYTFQWHDDKLKEDTVPNSLLALLIQTGLISITEDEIMDRSKSDPLAKIIALFQTFWFIAQCIARGVEGLSVTNIEILACAFAVLNIFTYFLWWNKPKRVRFPIKIDASDAEKAGLAVKEPTQKQSSTEAARPEESTAEQKRTEQSTAEAGKTGDPEVRRENDCGVRQGTRITSRQNQSLPMKIWRWIQYTLKAIGQEIQNDWRLRQRDFDNFHIPQWFLIRSFLYPFFTSWIHLGHLAGGMLYYQTGFYEWSGGAVFVLISIAVVFGGIHCIPWAFQFPSDTEQILWRVSSLLVTCIPVGIILVIFMGKIVLSLYSILYIAARIILIVLALMELRALPSSAYQTVEWTILIPHI
jgi:hypothetical protein